jgi:hypothetical protein
VNTSVQAPQATYSARVNWYWRSEPTVAYWDRLPLRRGHDTTDDIAFILATMYATGEDADQVVIVKTDGRTEEA